MIRYVTIPKAERPKKAKRQNPEQKLQRQVVEYLNTVLDGSRARFTHVPNQGTGDRIRGAILKGMGVLPGVPDIIVWFESGYRRRHGVEVECAKTLFIELKAGNNGLDPAQEEFMKFCKAVGLPYHLCKSVECVEKALEINDVPVRGRLS